MNIKDWVKKTIWQRKTDEELMYSIMEDDITAFSLIFERYRVPSLTTRLVL